MRVDLGSALQGISELERVRKTNGASTGKEVASDAGVSVNVSKADSLSAAATAQPEIRQDKVAQLRQAIESGNYQMSDDAIASAMMKDRLQV